MSAPVDVLAILTHAKLRAARGNTGYEGDLILARAAVVEMVIASKRASATLAHAYHTQLVGPLADYAHTDYQALDAALAKFGGVA